MMVSDQDHIAQDRQGTDQGNNFARRTLEVHVT